MSHLNSPGEPAGTVVEALKPLERALSKLQIRAITGSAQAQSPEQREFWLGYAMALDALRTAIRSIKAESPAKTPRKAWRRNAAVAAAIFSLWQIATFIGFAVYESAQSHKSADSGNHAGYSRNYGNPLALAGNPQAGLVDLVWFPGLGNGAAHQLGVDGLNGTRVKERDFFRDANAIQPVQQTLIAHTPNFRIREGSGSHQGVDALSELTRRLLDRGNPAAV